MYLPSCRMSNGSLSARLQCVVLLLLVVVIHLTLATTNTTQGPSTTSTNSNNPQKTSSSLGLDQRTVITLSVTFPAGLVLGIIWCWCMSKVCGTDQRPPKARLNHPASLNHVQRVHRTDSFDA